MKSNKLIGLLAGLILGLGVSAGMAWAEKAVQFVLPIVFATLGFAIGFLRDRLAVKGAALEHLNHILERQTMIDELSGLLNRRQLDLEIEREIERARRYKRSLAGVLIDIDDFKQINETRGQPIGDVAIQKIGAVVKGCIRKVDIAGRYGGDEFLIILPEAIMDSARVVAIRIQEAIQHCKIDLPRPSLSLTASIGLFAFPDCSFLDKKTFLETVEVAMMKAKKAGKNRIVSG